MGQEGGGFSSPQYTVFLALVRIGEFAHVVHPREEIDLIQEDEPDNRILECAQEARVGYIVSGDRHLQKLHAFQGMAILSPSEFLELQAGRWNTRYEIHARHLPHGNFLSPRLLAHLHAGFRTGRPAGGAHRPGPGRLVVVCHGLQRRQPL